MKGEVRGVGIAYHLLRLDECMTGRTIALFVSASMEF